MANANRFTMKIEGLETLRENLTIVTPRVATNILRGLVFDIARTLRDLMREKVATRTGTLRRALSAKRSRGSRDEVAAEVYTKQGKGEAYDGWYWHFVEYGTQHSSAEPFIQPSLSQMESQLPALMEGKFQQRLAKTVEREAKKGIR